MKTLMHNIPGHGASPERVREHAFCPATARMIADAVAENRARFRAAAELYCADADGNDLWPKKELSRESPQERRRRFLAALDELLDDFWDQDMIAEAEEML